MKFSITLIVLCFVTSSCAFWKKPQQLPPQANLGVGASHGEPPSQDPLPTASETLWVMKLDAKESRGRIDLTLDPNRALLGEKPAHSVTGLTGHVTLKVRKLPDGKYRIQVHDVMMRNQDPLSMKFQWSHFVGNIGVSIPAKVLKITHHSAKHPGIVSMDRHFSMKDHFFTVGGTAQVAGRGPVMSRGVGRRNVSLTIRKTEPVHLSGTLTVRNKIATLHIPRAVMRDNFDMEGSDLGMTFTGKIVARCKVP